MSLYSPGGFSGGSNTESFIQRQKRLNQAGTQKSTFAPNTGTQSPVTPTGGTNMQATTQAPQQPPTGGVDPAPAGVPAAISQGAPTFAPSMTGTQADWQTGQSQFGPSVSWQRMLAAHGGNMTPEQKAYAEQQVALGSKASNPFSSNYAPPAGGGPAAATGAMPNPALYSPYGPYPGRPGETNLQGMNLGNSQFATYSPTENATQHQQAQFSQWQNQDQQQTNASQSALINAILQNPHSLSQDVVSQMKGQQQDQALLMAQQAKNAALADRAGRGMQGGGAASRLIDNDTISNLLGGYRDIDIAKAQQDRADELNALGASEEILQGQLGRAGDQFNNLLKGQAAQAQENQFGSEFGLKRDSFLADERAKEYESVRSGQDAEIDRILKQFGINASVAESAQNNYGADVDAFFRNKDNAIDEKNLSLQEKLGMGGLDLDRQKLGENARQFDLGHALDALGFLEGRRQFNGDLGFKYNQLDQQGTQSIFDYLMGRK